MSASGHTDMSSEHLPTGVTQLEAPALPDPSSSAPREDERAAADTPPHEATESAATTRRRWDVTSLVVIPFLCVALIISALFLARTRLITGPFIGEHLTKIAQTKNIDLYVGSMRPSGLFGVRLERVRARVKRGHYVLDTHVDALDVSPDLWESIRRGAPVPAQVRLTGARILLSRDSTAPDTPAPPAQPEVAALDAVTAMGLEEITVVGVDVDVELRAGRAFASSAPVRFDRLEATLPLRGAPLPTTMNAYGRFPDGVPFSMSTEEIPNTKGRHIILEPQRATRIHEWFSGQLPFELNTQGLIVCSGCEQDSIDLGAVDMTLPNLGRGVHVTAPTARVVWSEGHRGELQLEGVGIQGLADPGAEIELTHTHFMFDASSGAHTGELTVHEGDDGVLEMTWLWDGPAQLFSSVLEADTFSLRPLLALLDADPFLRAGEVTGSMSASVDLAARSGELAMDVQVQGAHVHAPMITRDPILIPSMGVRSDLFVDVPGKALSLSSLEVDLGDVRPVKLKGHILAAQPGWRFEIDALGRDLEASALKQALPPAISRPMKGSALTGHFGFDLHASGHSAYPKSLRLTFDIDGDVEVLHDGPDADIHALASAGAPGMRGDPTGGPHIPTHAAEWIPYDNLPTHVPRGLLAAEDATFFEHNGFDFGGLARAMMHNLDVGRMERGGSTITQQLIKNLYLTHDRTAIRKLQEAYLTWRIETELSKERILEIYLNIVHWGRDVYGIHQAAQHYFGSAPEALSIEQIALLSAILPNPHRFGDQLLRGLLASSRLTKFEHIMSNLRYLGDISAEEYRELMDRANAGEIGPLHLTICKDDETAPIGAPGCSEMAKEGDL